ncbi:MAG: SpaA isopeptide-forming pilin-related protein [Frisingicoccus sp.]
MKGIKKIASLILALALVLAMNVTAFAEDTTYSITVKNAQAKETYRIYKILDLEVNEDRTAYSYILNTEWSEFFTSGAGKDYAETKTVGTQTYVTWKNDKKSADDLETFGRLAASYAKGKSAEDTITPDSDDDIVFSGLEPGYYLITSTNGNQAMVETTPPDPTDFEGKMKTRRWIRHKRGRAVRYERKQRPDWRYGEFSGDYQRKERCENYVMHDKMDDGLTFDATSVKIAGLTVERTILLRPKELKMHLRMCTFEIVFTETYLNNLTDNTALTVIYSAVLNKDAVTDIGTGEKNQAQLTWGDNGKTEWSETTTKTYQFEVLKYAASDNGKNPLAGAAFELHDSDNNLVKLIKVSDTEYRVAEAGESGAADTFMTVGSGKIVIKGVDLGEYTLTETKAPAGYNKLNGDKAFTVEAGNTLVVEIENQSGSVLPSTGGRGTTLFYIIGGVLVIGAGVLLVTKKRMSDKDKK